MTTSAAGIPPEIAAQFVVNPDNYGEDISMEHLDCGPVREWTWRVKVTLDLLNATAAEHMREAHGG